MQLLTISPAVILSHRLTEYPISALGTTTESAAGQMCSCLPSDIVHQRMRHIYFMTFWPKVVPARTHTDAQLRLYSTHTITQHRLCLHKLLALPTHRPALRTSMALQLEDGADAHSSDSSKQQSRLRDVHLHLPPPSESLQFLVCSPA